MKNQLHMVCLPSLFYLRISHGDPIAFANFNYNFLYKLIQARSQEFGGEGARIWVPATKEVRGCQTRKFLKNNVHAIWCIILHLLHKNHYFSEFQSNVFVSALI